MVCAKAPPFQVSGRRGCSSPQGLRRWAALFAARWACHSRAIGILNLHYGADHGGWILWDDEVRREAGSPAPGAISNWDYREWGWVESVRWLVARLKRRSRRSSYISMSARLFMVWPNPLARLRSIPPQFSRYDTAVLRIFIGRSILASFMMEIVQALGHRKSRVFNKGTEPSCGMGQILPARRAICSPIRAGNSVIVSDILKGAHSSK
jgi:hypothetical protein